MATNARAHVVTVSTAFEMFNTLIAQQILVLAFRDRKLYCALLAELNNNNNITVLLILHAYPLVLRLSCPSLPNHTYSTNLE